MAPEMTEASGPEETVLQDIAAQEGPALDRRAVQTLALALWQVQQGAEHPRADGARRAAWREARPEMMRTARKLARRLARAGVTLSVAPDAAEPTEAVEPREATAA